MRDSDVPLGRAERSDEQSTPAARHTPGPWHWDSDPIKDDPQGRVRYRVVAKGRTITQCYYPSGDGVAEADTRLIAAAPDLLAALKVLQPYFAGEHAYDHPHCVQLRAAIAKAEGTVPEREGLSTERPEGTSNNPERRT